MFVTELRKLIPEIRAEVADIERADAILALLAMMQGKALNYNSYLSSWHVSRAVMRSVFDTHNFAFKSTYAEFEAGSALFSWCLEQLLDAYKGIAELLKPSQKVKMGASSEVTVAVPGSTTVIR